MNYYKEISQEINTLINDGKYQQALEKINQELSMPYIPANYEEVFLEYKKQCLSYLRKDNRVILDDNQVKDFLFSNNIDQMYLALDYLAKSNIRNYMDLIQHYLLWDDKDDMVAYLLIQALHNQDINKELIISKNRQQIKFNPDKCHNLENNYWLNVLSDTLNDVIGNDDISAYNIIHQYIVETYIHLYPIDINELEDIKLLLKNVLDSYYMQFSIEKNDWYDKIIDVLEKKEHLS